MKKILNIKNIAILLVIISVVIISFIIKPSNKTIIEKKEDSLIKNSDNKLAEVIYVDIKGAVKKPGVYQLSNNNMIIDAINIAGGLTKYASTKNINLSKKLYSEMVIYVFTTSELKKKKTDSVIINNVPDCHCETVTINDCVSTNNNDSNVNSNITDQNSSSDNNQNQVNDLLVNINLADIVLLQTLSGIGESKAKAIISYREKNGFFKEIEEIKNVSGIGESTYNNIKDLITV